MKIGGAEKGRLSKSDLKSILKEAQRLEAQLEPASEQSPLPDAVQNYDALDDFLAAERMR